MPADQTTVPTPELVAALRVALAEAAVPEPIAVSESEAARLVGVSYKTLASLPAAETGRAKIGRRVVYELATLRAFIRQLVARESTETGT